MSRAKRPLNKSAVKKADAEFYAKHPELKGTSLSGRDPKQAALRKEWMELYEKSGGEIEKLSRKPEKTCTETTEKCSSESPTLAQIKEIQKLIDANKYQKAINKTIEYYEIDVSNVKGKVTYDSSLAGAETSSDGSVELGSGHITSPGWLASSIAHETEVHVNEQAEEGNWYTDEPDGINIQECEAYDYEIANKDRFGLTDDEVKSLEKTRKAYYDGMSQEYKDQADKGIYTRPTPSSP